MAEDRDGSQLTLTVAYCEAERERRISVDVRPVGGSSARRVLSETQSLDRAPFGAAALIDLEGDGIHEVEIRGSCGAGPNCEGTIFRLNVDGSAMERFFESGYDVLLMIDGFLVESGRASCCSWEFKAYWVDPAAARVTEEDIVLRIDVTTEGGEDGGPPVVECSFHRREGEEWIAIGPPSDAWLPLCMQYGEDYRLRGGNMDRG